MRTLSSWMTNTPDGRHSSKEPSGISVEGPAQAAESV